MDQEKDTGEKAEEDPFPPNPVPPTDPEPPLPGSAPFPVPPIISLI